MIDPETQQPQPCAHCDPQAKRVGLIGGGMFILIAVVLIIALAAAAIVLLNS